MLSARQLVLDSMIAALREAARDGVDLYDRAAVVAELRMRRFGYGAVVAFLDEALAAERPAPPRRSLALAA